MTHTPLEERIWYHYPYVLPAALLSDEPTHDGDPSSLRAEASHDDICLLSRLTLPIVS